MSTSLRGTPGANNSPFTRKLSITISTRTSVAFGASGSGGCSNLASVSICCCVSEYCSVVSKSHLRCAPRVPIIESPHELTPFAEQSSPLRVRQRPHNDGVELRTGMTQDLLHRVFVRARLTIRPL